MIILATFTPTIHELTLAPMSLRGLPRCPTRPAPMQRERRHHESHSLHRWSLAPARRGHRIRQALMDCQPDPSSVGSSSSKVGPAFPATDRLPDKRLAGMP